VFTNPEKAMKANHNYKNVFTILQLFIEVLLIWEIEKRKRTVNKKWQLANHSIIGRIDCYHLIMSLPIFFYLV
jgi:hypothetical protein